MQNNQDLFNHLSINSMEHNKKIWLVTGATAGLGKALAEKIAQQGDIAIGTTRRQEGLEELAGFLPGPSFGVVMDTNDPKSIETAVAAILQKYGRIDVLVNNAGYGIMGAVEEVSEAEAREQMETNFFGVLKLTQAVLPVMRAQGSGHIIQLSSRLGITALPGFGLYAASKFALEGMSESLAAEVAPFNIKVTMVQPGPIRTEFFGRSGKFAAQQLEAYASVTTFAREAKQKVHGQQDGDPAKMAKAITDMAALDNPPLRLPLTPATLEAMEQKMNWLQQDLHNWSKVAADTAFERYSH